MTIGAVLPVKDKGDAKQRLAGFLSAAERQRLALAMAEDVLATLARVPGLSDIVVVTRDEQAMALAARHGARVLTEPSNDGQSAAVERAAAALGREGADGLLQVPGDVPGASADEIEASAANFRATTSRFERLVLVGPEDARKELRLQLAEEHVAVGHAQRTTAPIARGSRVRSGRLRSHPVAGAVERADRAAARRHSVDHHHRCAHAHPRHQRLEGALVGAVVVGDVGRGPAHVERDDALVGPRGPRSRPHPRCRRPVRTGWRPCPGTASRR